MRERARVVADEIKIENQGARQRVRGYRHIERKTESERQMEKVKERRTHGNT